MLLLRKDLQHIFAGNAVNSCCCIQCNLCYSIFPKPFIILGSSLIPASSDDNIIDTSEIAYDLMSPNLL